ncbi:MAG: hypothetical protein JXB49_06510 [Bacteroidales bacterium]|nr:hypothetical protein [Bacteroidales bacterium]
MKNKYLLARLDGIQKQLIAVYNGGHQMSTSTKGREREYFADLFLRNCLPPHCRLGSGEIIDTIGINRSGQVDIIIEFPYFSSLPLLGTTQSRLYFAESVAFAVEVKSDLKNEWKKVLDTAKNIKKLDILGGGGTGRFVNRFNRRKIPVIAVGFKGWKDEKTVEKKRIQSNIDAILQIEPTIFSCPRNNNESILEKGSGALGAFLFIISETITQYATKHNDLFKYINDF